MKQNKILKFIYFCRIFFPLITYFQNGILTVLELDLYQRLKFSLKSLTNLHGEKYFNEMLKYEESKMATTRQRKGSLSLSSGKKEILKFSLQHRSAILKKLNESKIITPFTENSSTKSYLISVTI